MTTPLVATSAEAAFAQAYLTALQQVMAGGVSGADAVAAIGGTYPSGADASVRGPFYAIARVLSSLQPAATGAWQAATYTGGWSSYNPAFFDAAYCLDASGFVHLRGLVKGSTGTGSGNPIFNLPVGYRPARQLYFAIGSGGAWGDIQITAAGSVYVDIGSTGYAQLDGLTFDTRP